MRNSRFSEEQIIGILKAHQTGMGAKELSGSTASTARQGLAQQCPEGGRWHVLQVAFDV
ncbi:hypothetical protein [Pseudophaeobacter sp.]|uniref:hypothetical protein n=1 Tax=Pseudophaeobacter sp. TaxID=1971739 RepID=UPI0032973B53